MKIAVCEDDPYELEQIVKILDNYRRETNAELVYQTFTNAHELLEEVRKDVFDVLFLDILMPVTTGVQAAREVRGFNDEIKIVFLTVSSEFAVESYAVKAYDYLLKPSSNETVFPILDRIRHQKEMQEECLAVKLQSGIANLPFSKLACVEVLNRTLLFHLFDGTSAN